MVSKYISKLGKRAITILLIILLLEFCIVALILYFQPTHQDMVIEEINQYKFDNGFGYASPDLGSTFYGVSALDMLGVQMTSEETSSILDFILSNQDPSSGLFKNDLGQLSLHETYYAVGALNQIGQIENQINQTQIQTSVLSLQTNNSMFRDYTDIDTFHKTYGDLDSLFEATSILSKLSQNTTEYYLSLNRTLIAQNLALLQATDGSVSGGLFHNDYTMKNAYFFSSVIEKLNVSISFFEEFGFHSELLINWIDQMYTGESFSMTVGSKPTIEASAYALIALSRFGMSNSDINSQYGKAIEEIVHEVIEEIQDEEDPIDALHDIILALSITDNLNLLNVKSFSGTLEFLIGFTIITTSLLLLIAFAANITKVLREDDSEYFDTFLGQIIPKILEKDEGGNEELSKEIDIEIKNIVLIEHQDPSIGTLRILSEDFELLISFKFETWDPLSLKVIKSGSNEELYSIDFYESILTKDLQDQLRKVIEEQT